MEIGEVRRARLELPAAFVYNKLYNLRRTVVMEQN